MKRTYLKSIISGIAVAGMLCLGTLNAQADMTGDYVWAGHSFDGTTFAGPPDVSGPVNLQVPNFTTVVADPGGLIFGPTNAYHLFVMAESIMLQFLSDPNQFNYGDQGPFANFNGALVTGMEWSPIPGFITGVNVTSFIHGVLNTNFDSAARVDFDNLLDGGLVSVDLKGYCNAGIGCTAGLGSLGTGDWILVNLDHEPVPEPSTMLLLGTGLAGLVGWRRYRKTQETAKAA